MHAFPNAKVEIADVVNTTTVEVGNLSSIPVHISWEYASGNGTGAVEGADALSAASLNANVCFDTFLDSNATLAISTTDSAYEVMIWLGQYGLSTQPIGNTDGTKGSLTVNGTTFELYEGTNSNTQQTVFTWVASTNTTDFEGDITPLFTGLSTYGGPTSTDHLGYIAFGSETLYADDVVTFTVSTFDLDLVTG